LLFSGKTRSPALAYIFGKLAHGFFRNNPAFASGDRCFRDVHRRQNFGATPLAFFPEGEGFPRRFFGPVQSSGFDGIPDECLLVLSRFDFHVPKVGVLPFYVNLQTLVGKPKKS
jgi:hypothetical protein